MKIAYFTSNRTTLPPNPSEIAASSTITLQLINQLSSKHEITLFAAKGSQIPNIKIVDLGLPPFTPDSNIADNDWITKASQGMKQLYIGELFKRANEFDLIHLQTEPVYLAMPYASLIKTPVLFTTHNGFHTFEKDIFKFFDKKIYFSALSNNHASQFPLTQQIPVVYNGIEANKYPFQDNCQDYFLYLGRLHKDKGIDTFLELAQKMPQFTFYISGKGHKSYEDRIKNLADQYKNIRYFGMLERESPEWFNIYSNAKALIVPVAWEEPFGLTMIEAMATGTPVIAFARGSVPEIIKDSQTGFIINSSQENTRGNWITKKTGIDGLMEAINHIHQIPQEEYKQMRLASRQHVETNFSVNNMVAGYEKIYNEIISNHKI